MNVKVYLDTRRPLNGGLAPLKYVICHRGKSALMSSGIAIDPRRWDPLRLVVKSGGDKAQINDSIARRVAMIKGVIGKIVADSPGLLTATELKNKVLSVLGVGITLEENYHALAHTEVIETKCRSLFLDYFASFMSRLKKSTAGNYEIVYRRMQAFDSRVPSYAFEDITPTWVEDYLTFVAKTAPSQNSRNNHISCIRNVFNRAREDGLTTAYPFRKIKTKTAQTEHRTLSPDDLRYIFGFKGGKAIERTVDYFFLMFCLIGINTADIFDLKKTDVWDGRLHYTRKKTGRLYSIKLEPEALKLIKKHSGKGQWLLDCHDRTDDHLNWRKSINEALKRIGRPSKGEPGRYPFLSTYYARHSWATVAHNDCEVDFESIRLALGHGVKTVTDVYIAPDLEKIDKANRKVLDFVLYNKVETQKGGGAS